jgi:hypothetical protein
MTEAAARSVLSIDVPGRASTPWWDYVESVAGADTLSEIARRAGISSTTIPRWRRTTQPVDAGDAVAFARAYGRSPLEALVVAGYLTADEANAGLSGRRR